MYINSSNVATGSNLKVFGAANAYTAGPYAVPKNLWHMVH
jgi:hypothetical protein